MRDKGEKSISVTASQLAEWNRLAAQWTEEAIRETDYETSMLAADPAFERFMAKVLHG